jgi:hypothetical protein
MLAESSRQGFDTGDGRDDNGGAAESPSAGAFQQGQPMGKRVYSAISKFKTVEVELRTATNGFRTTMEKIDKALCGPRTDGETALLRSIRDQVAKLRDDAAAVLHRLYSEVETKSR